MDQNKELRLLAQQLATTLKFLERVHSSHPNGQRIAEVWLVARHIIGDAYDSHKWLLAHPPASSQRDDSWIEDDETPTHRPLTTQTQATDGEDTPQEEGH